MKMTSYKSAKLRTKSLSTCEYSFHLEKQFFKQKCKAFDYSCAESQG